MNDSVAILVSIPEYLMIWSLSRIPRVTIESTIKIIRWPTIQPIVLPKAEAKLSWKSPRTIEARFTMLTGLVRDYSTKRNPVYDWDYLF